ncbi:MAG TPA: hypothetical protein VM013_03120 [Dehalococcoidia bacterium]|nr:hypothetical protein [Dehalococcoidia bacterium]
MTETEVPGNGNPAATSLTVTIGTGFWRVFFKWAVGLLLVSTLGVLLLSVDATQLTASGTAHKALRRTVASLTEIDALIEDRGQMVTTSAGSGGSASSVLIGFPIDVPLSEQEAQNLSTAELRDVILDRSADRLYTDGFSAFREGGRGSVNVDILSPPGAVRYTAGLLTEDNHELMRVVLALVAGFAAILTVALVLLSRGYGRLTSVGAAVVAACLPPLLLSVTVRFILRMASEEESDYLTAQLYALGRDVAWLPIRNAITFACLGVVFLTMGVAFSLLSKKRQPSLR